MTFGSPCTRCGIQYPDAARQTNHVSEDRLRATTVLDDYQPAALPVSLLYGASRFLPLKLRAFLDFAAPRLKASLAS